MDNNLYKNILKNKAKEKAIGGNSIQEVSIDKLIENPYQPRIEIRADEVKELAESIKKDGLLQPIIVSKNDNGTYTIIAGHRRVAAHKLLNKNSIKAIVYKNQKDINLAAKAIIENLQRKDLNIIENAIALKRYKEEFKKSLDEVAAEIGKSKSYVSQVLSILNLPEEIIRDVKENKSTNDVTSLNLLNNFYNKLKKFSMLNSSQNAEFKGVLEDEKIKNEILALYRGFLANGREWLKKEIKKKLHKLENNKQKELIFIKPTTRGVTIKISKKLNEDEIKRLKEIIERELWK